MKTPTIISNTSVKLYLVTAPKLTENGSVPAVRTDKETAEIFLKDNESVIIGGTVRYFQIKHIGFSVYEIKLRPFGKVNTYVVDTWEKQVIYNNQVF